MKFGSVVLLGGLAMAGVSVAVAEEPVETTSFPTLRKEAELAQPGNVTISPDGSKVAYVIRGVDWERNRRTTQLWVMAGGETRQLSEIPGFSGRFHWTPDSNWIAYVSRGDRAALRLVRSDSKATMGPFDLPAGTRDIEISPDGTRLALTIREPESPKAMESRELFGRHEVKGEGYRMTHLWFAQLNLPKTLESRDSGVGVARRLTDGAFTVGQLAWSPDGTHIAFDHAPNPEPNSSYASDVSVVEVASGRNWPVAAERGYERGPLWSPDSGYVLYSSAMGVAVSNLPSELIAVPREGGRPRLLTERIPTEPRPVAWTTDGVWVMAEDRTSIHLYQIDPSTGATTKQRGLPEIISAASFAASGAQVAVTGASPESLEEIYTGKAGSTSFERATDFTKQVSEWPLGTREIISWKASDGLEIEGVLLKPKDYDPGKQYPLMVVVHGGPRGADRPTLLPRSLYPITQWLADGVLVLRPNYRGGTGYGPEFRKAHHRTVGPGDAMDVQAGVDYLISQGVVDGDRVGLMGWSYGGFVSAYLTATSNTFKAISVGAGISDWRVHYAWEDANITTKVFSFGVSPWEDPEAWTAASPITHIKSAQTPTLIQHMVGDPVVSILSGYELYQALVDLGVETRFVQFPSATHGPADPKAALAVAWQNYKWFSEKIWGRTPDRESVLGH